MLRRTAIAIATLVTLASPADADWPAGGKLVSSPGDINGTRHAFITELPSGDLIVVGMGTAGNNFTYNVQRLTHGGLVSPGWPMTGVAFTPVLRGTPFRSQSIVVDDLERVWHTWSAGANSALESVGKTGLRLPASGSYFAGPSAGGPTHAAPAPGGEAFVTNGGNRIRRFTPGGQPAVGWTMAGVVLPGTGFHDNAILPEISGGAVVFMRVSNTTGLPTAIRISPNGGVPPPWTTAGLTLSTVAPNFSDIGPLDSQLIPSGIGRFLAVWSLDAGSGKRRIMMQRFLNNATLDPAWPVDGIEVVAADTIVACRAIPDGFDGAYIVRQSHGRPVATHITSAGTLLGAPDTDLLDAAAQYIEPKHAASTSVEDLAFDVTSDGGLLFGWNDARLAPTASFRLRWLTPTLTPAPGKPADGLVYTPGSPHPYDGALVAVHADGPSGAFIAWGDYHDIGGSQVYGDIWMTYVQAPTTTGVGTSPPRALRLSAPRPNPATGSVAFDLVLPDDSGARVELLDIAGRVQRTLAVEGAGSHAIAFDQLDALSPGLYFARVTSRQGSTAVRVIVSR